MDYVRFLFFLEITRTNMNNFEHVLNEASESSQIDEANRQRIQRHREWLRLKHVELNRLCDDAGVPINTMSVPLNTINYIIEMCMADLVGCHVIDRSDTRHNTPTGMRIMMQI